MIPLLSLFYIVAVKVFKKTAPNGKITVYLGKRDFGDHGSYCEPVEGVLLVDNEYLKGRKVFGQVTTTFRYGREEDEVMGLHFSRQLYLALEQVLPTKKNEAPSDFQNRLVRKLGTLAHPFTFALPENAPPSVTLQPGSEDQGRPLGVEYELKLFIAETEDEKPHKRNSVSMAIRKLQYAKPSPLAKQPSALVSKGFMMSSGKLQLEVTLDKELYFHGDKVSANVTISNYSKKTVKNIKVAVVQNTEVTMVNGHFHKTISSIESKEGCPITPGATLSKVYTLLPLASQNKDKRGIALDGMLKEGDTNLASSTLNSTGDAIGIVISYVIRVRLYMGAIGGELVADVSFKLANPEPVPVVPGSQESKAQQEKARMKKQLSREMSTDLIVEDFARRRQFSEDNE
ncbi:arrestin, lateral eye [Limulus polyphemus]|uniref:Arrestin, lateral eye n=1 Tax=Limulus polyphemus TaxID=6850 RepID=ARRH_LIMPO|nr:arrestin, lateral eye [Limulus polyphemus]P51484.1 RecName: Full=Arrestin, lateral eye [Limulus polyphemus]AAA82007.1 arrestin [Limulus polyphemus]